MSGPSILFRDPGAVVLETTLPDYASDLLLDQVIAHIIKGADEYDLLPYFATRLSDVRDVTYRQEVFTDLEDQELTKALVDYGEAMHLTRTRLAQSGKRYFERFRQAWVLAAGEAYVTAVDGLLAALGAARLHSEALQALRRYVSDYATGPVMTRLRADSASLRARMDAITYALRLSGDRITVQAYDGEPDLSTHVLATFEKFSRGAAKDYRSRTPNWPDSNHIEAHILELVAALHPDEFAALERFCAEFSDVLDPALLALERDVQFYLVVARQERWLEAGGVDFTMPTIDDRSTQVDVRGTVDVALADKLAREHRQPVRNDVTLLDGERIFVVSGPNQGGKTTFARTVGQLFHLAALGCRVPGTSARLFLPDSIHTHFEHPEDVRSLRGKLQDELIRVHRIIESSTARSVVILNEILNSTTLEDALVLGTRIMDQLIDLDVLAVYVTFVDELASRGPSVVSLMSQVEPEDPAARTFRVVRQPANGMAYAAAIAHKYRVDYEHLSRRVSR
ncbi:MAG: hypothetical protein L0H25_02680 [Micrococcales bacterium]|nr:hypothetical protein [Micrococcales bacterium]